MLFRRPSRFMPALALLALVLLLALPAPAHAQQADYVVQRGDTLSSIAARHGTSVQAIMNANGLRNPNFVYAGQRLVIPGGSAAGGGAAAGGVHVVGWGQTLSQIAATYGTSVSAFVQANGLANANAIYAGQRLRIPTTGSGASTGSGGTSSGGTTGGEAAPGGGVHVVQRGETLSSIAQYYGNTTAAIAAANNLVNPNLVYVGQRLRIPSGASAGNGASGGTSSGGTSGGGVRWIEVDLSSQQVMAHRGDTVVKTMVVSTGTSRYPTPPGEFRIYSKYPSVTMSGPGYYLEGVPHSMFFYRGYALHGTYWHSNFGTPMSHGCINLTRSDAAWLYDWAPVGTLVSIHW